MQASAAGFLARPNPGITDMVQIAISLEGSTNMVKIVTQLVFMMAVMAVLCVSAMCTDRDSGMINASATAVSAGDLAFALMQIQADMQGSLNDMDPAVGEASHNLSATGLEGAGAREVLSKLIKSNPRLTEAVTISKEGKIIVSESKEYKGAEGADISKQDAIVKLLGTEDPDPIFSSLFQTAEGFDAVALIYPVYSTDGKFLGGISATFEPEKVVKALVSPWINETDRSFWIMQTDGLMIYDNDAGQIGKNIFEDPHYKPFTSLLTMAEKMVSERSGHGSYDFQITEGDTKVVTKEVYWTTAGLHGREWRLAITRIMR